MPHRENTPPLQSLQQLFRNHAADRFRDRVENVGENVHTRVIEMLVIIVNRKILQPCKIPWYKVYAFKKTV